MVLSTRAYVLLLEIDKMFCQLSFQIRVSVDGIEKTGTTSGEYKMLSSNILYVAGSPNTGDLPGSRIRNNFKGCMKNVSTTLN
jgi:hypothetical protein